MFVLLCPLRLHLLQARNVELAAILEKRNHTNEQLTVQLGQLRDSNQRLQQQLASERTNSEATLQRELTQAREQVGAHLQTVGILVAEKSELQSQLSHSQRLAQQRLQVGRLCGQWHIST